MLRAGRTGVALIALLLGLAGAGPAAAAMDVSCGQVISNPGVYTLGDDLNCTEAIEIRAGGVTLDLRGHTLSGYGSERMGILIWFWGGSPAEAVLVKNGIIRGFSVPPTDTYGLAGIWVGAGYVKLQHLSLSENEIGVDVYGAGASAEMQHNVIDHNGAWGVVARPGSAVYVASNRIVRNGSGIYATYTRGGYIRGNFVAFNAFGGVGVNNAVAVERNMLIHNGGNGLTLTSGEGASGAQFQVATDNLAIGNGGYGIWSEFPLALSNSIGNRAAGNGSSPQCWNVVCSP